jgi:hypothetical protein
VTRCGDNLDRVPEHRAWLVRGKKADEPERLPAWPKLSLMPSAAFAKQVDELAPKIAVKHPRICLKRCCGLQKRLSKGCADRFKDSF